MKRLIEYCVSSAVVDQFHTYFPSNHYAINTHLNYSKTSTTILDRIQQTIECTFINDNDATDRHWLWLALLGLVCFCFGEQRTWFWLLLWRLPTKWWNRFSTLNKSIPTIPSLEIAEIQELEPYIQKQNHDWTIKSVNNCWMFRMCWSWLISHRAVHEVLKEDIKEMDSSRSFNIYTACLTHSWYKYRWKLE